MSISTIVVYLCCNQKHNTMTIQDLKNNREVILNKMNDLGVKDSMKKEFIKTMVDFVEVDLNESEDVEELVLQVFTLNSEATRKWKGKKPSNSLRETMGKIEEAEGNTFKKWCPLRKEYV